MNSSHPHRWAVTGQEEHPVIGEDGRPTTEHHVRFVTASGHESHVTLKDEHYSAQNVAAQIHHKATEIEKVHAMHSESTPAEPGKE